MRRKRHKTTHQPAMKYEQAEAVTPDPVRRAASFLISFGIIASILVLADAIVYTYRPSANNVRTVFLGLWDRPGSPEDKEEGEQKTDPDETEPKSEPEPKPEPEPVQPPAPPVEIEPPKPPVENPGNSTDQRPTVIAVRGVGRPSHSPFGNRGRLARAKALGKYGGSPQTENAVRLGLLWLARHQDEDGKWSRTHFDRHCRPGRKCGGVGRWPTVRLEPAMTGLALLAFLGHDNTHRRGEFKDHVERAAKYLCGVQTKSGLFGRFRRSDNQYMMYNQGIATFALAELYALSGDASLRPTVERAVRFILAAQQGSGAWDYTDMKTGRYDTSVTGWQVMALKSAQAAGIDLPHYNVYKLVRFFERVTMPNGEVYYSNKFPSAGRRGQGMVAVGMASSQFLGLPLHSRQAKLQASRILDHLPAWKKLERSAVPMDSIYYWYYATLAMFQYGGPAWDKWNRAMKRTLLAHQRIGGCVEGSWDPPRNFWGRVGGRLYATTLNILNLEVYYRYLPLYQGGALKTVPALLAIARGPRRDDAVLAVRLLGKFQDEAARGFLIRLANSNDRLAVEASLALARTKDAAAIAPLLQHLRSPNQWVRHQALRAMAPMIDRGLAPAFIDALEDPSPTVARQAARILRRYAKVSFGFEPEAPPAERRKAVEKWRAWWQSRRKGDTPAAGSVPWLVVQVRPEKGYVAFNTGRAGLARAGRVYSVYRGSEYVGKITCVATDGALAVGRVIRQFTKTPPRKGDVVKPPT